MIKHIGIDCLFQQGMTYEMNELFLCWGIHFNSKEKVIIDIGAYLL